MSDRPPSLALLALEGRAFAELGAFFQTLPLLHTAPRGDGHPVLVLPGFTASDVSTAPLRGFLRRHGYDATGWGQGRNRGPRPGVELGMIRRLEHMYWRTGRKVSVVGWSLGGIYARELARQRPEMIRLIVTLGSPFAGARATNVDRIFEAVSGLSIDELDAEFLSRMRETPPVPSTAVYSTTDGVAHWQACIDAEEDEQTENVRVPGSHCGLGHNPLAVYVIADRLAQPEGEWRPFERGGWRGLVFPPPLRNGTWGSGNGNGRPRAVWKAAPSHPA